MHEHVCLKEAIQSLRNNTTVLDLWPREVEDWELKKKQPLVSTGSTSGEAMQSSTAPHCGQNRANRWNTVVFSLLFKIYMATAAFTSTSHVWQKYNGLHFGRSSSHFHSLKQKLADKQTACKYSIWKYTWSCRQAIPKHHRMHL